MTKPSQRSPTGDINFKSIPLELRMLLQFHKWKKFIAAFYSMILFLFNYREVVCSHRNARFFYYWSPLPKCDYIPAS
jgi:hypothetical protein